MNLFTIVPKLRLGTHSAKLRFARRRDNRLRIEAELLEGSSQAELGNQEKVSQR
jgi:hypothetical protein